MTSYLHMVVNFAGYGTQQAFAEMPRVCPVCHHRTEPFRLAARSTTPDDRSVDFALECSRPECRRIFVASYRMGLDREFDLLQTFGPRDASPSLPPARARPRRRTDAEIAETARHALKRGDIGVTVRDGWVGLYGEVESREQRIQAESTVRELAGVTEVSNHLAIRTKSPSRQAADPTCVRRPGNSSRVLAGTAV